MEMPSNENVQHVSISSNDNDHQNNDVDSSALNHRFTLLPCLLL